MFNKVISYQNEIAIASDRCVFVNTIGGGVKQPCHYSSWIVTWERWKILSRTIPSGAVKFGDKVGFENQIFSGQYLSGFDSPSLVSQNLFQDFEEWILVPVDSTKNGQVVQNCDEFYMTLANNSLYVGVNENDPNVIPFTNNESNAMKFRLTLLEVL